MTSLRRAWLLSLLAVSAGCTQDFGLFEPSGGSGGSGNQGGGGSGNQGGGGSGNQGGGGTGNQGGGGAGNQGGGGAGNQGGGGSGGCSSPAQCPDPGDCQSATCDMGACGTIQDAMGTPCGPNNMQVCDAAGACVDCLTANDCPNPGDACMNGACVASSCMDGMQNGAETDQDCGGPICPKCAVNDGCMAASDCVTNLCVGGTCEECQSEFDCDQADFCDEAANPNVCKPELVDGTPCMNNSDCVSNECTDGYCCDVACQGNCESCDGALTGQANGVCSPVTAGSDPFGGCNDFGCGSGTCDGNGACGFDPPNTPCGNTVCANGTVTTGACQANGMCQAGGLVSDCGGHACNGNGSGCDTDCNGQDNQCVLGFHCVGSNCVADIAQGGACNVTNDCVLGLTCIDGVCCDTPCGALCQACTAAKKGAGADGTCGFVMMGSDPDNECAGNCNGSGACM